MGRIPLSPNRDAHLAIIKLAAELEISELYATQYALNLGLYQLNKISQKVYERDKAFWSSKLAEEEPEQPKKLSYEELQAKQKQDELTRHFGRVLNEWSTYKDDFVWVERTVNYARKFKDTIPDAQKVVDLGEVILRNHVVFSQSQVTCDKSLGGRNQN